MAPQPAERDVSVGSKDAADVLTEHQVLLNRLIDTQCVPSGVQVKPLRLTNDVVQPEDAPSRSTIANARGRPVAVMFLSSPVSPGLIGRNLANARAAGAMLGEDLGSVILEPWTEGRFEGRTYAVWPWYRPLSDYKPWAHCQKLMLRAPVLAWLRDATLQTNKRVAPADLDVKYREPLAYVEKGPFSHEMRESAGKALARLNSGAWMPRSVLEHGDWWLGNVLLPRRRHRHRRGFFLIDWGGARLAGYPFLDLLRYARSASLDRRRLRREVALHCEAIRTTREDAVGCFLAGIGFSAMNLEHGSMERFLIVAEANFESLLDALE